MNILVTAGNTQVPLDRVRCLTNIFTGRTGTQIALAAIERGHAATLLTSHPKVLRELHPADPGKRLRVFSYRTFDDLRSAMENAIGDGRPDAVIHSAAVSDYVSAGIYAAAPDTRFDAAAHCWHGEAPALVDRSAGKVKSVDPARHMLVISLLNGQDRSFMIAKDVKLLVKGTMSQKGLEDPALKAGTPITVVTDPGGRKVKELKVAPPPASKSKVSASFRMPGNSNRKVTSRSSMMARSTPTCRGARLAAQLCSSIREHMIRLLERSPNGSVSRNWIWWRCPSTS